MEKQDKSAAIKIWAVFGTREDVHSRMVFWIHCYLAFK